MSHAYFDTLVARPDHWKSYSLRDHQQMLDYRHTAARPMAVTYDPANDEYPLRQDAAKVRVRVFGVEPYSTLAQPLTADATTITLKASNASMSSALAEARSLKIDNEEVIVKRPSGVPVSNSTVTIVRGARGTTPADHALGTEVFIGQNSLPNQLRMPVDTIDGHAYLFTWDTWYGPEFEIRHTGIGNYKTFLLGAPIYWLQIDTRFSEVRSPWIGNVGGRGNRGGRPFAEAYGPNVKSETPLEPRVGVFPIAAATWTRYWVLVEQGLGGDNGAYDPVTVWVADETREPMKIFDRLQMNVPTSIAQFIVEFNTSSNATGPTRQDLIAYVRNWAALQDPQGIDSLLIRPNAGVPLPPPVRRVVAPRNIRLREASL